MSTPSKTTNRLHFEDLSPNRFEDLSLALVYRLQQWEDIHHDGRTGADDGVDIRALTTAPDGSLRAWSIQCKRYTKFSAVDGKAAVREAVTKTTVAPDVMLLIVGCDVSFAARKAYETAATAAGIGSALLWTASKLEMMLWTDHPDLLFGYFGISTARKERTRETNLRRVMAMKRKLKRVFPAQKYKPRIIVRSIDDESYPESVEVPSGSISPWFRVEFCGHYHGGVEVYLNIEYIVVDKSSDAWSTITYGEGGLPSTTREEEFFKETPYSVVKVFVIGRIPFRNIFEVDEDGDEFYAEPHLYCKFADRGEPYEEVIRREVDGYAQFHNDRRFPFAERDRRLKGAHS